MSYETFRVEITRDETRDEGAVTIEVTAYFDRVPETDIPTRGMLTRAAKGVWDSRLQFTGDFETLGRRWPRSTPPTRMPSASAATNTRSMTNSPARLRRSSNPAAHGIPPTNRQC